MERTVKLIGREPEIEKLDKLLHSGEPEFLAVYGRRRVGKTYLVRQYLKDSIVFDFTGTKDAAKEQQLLHFFNEYIKRSGKKSKQVPATWFEAFQLLATYLKASSKSKAKQVVFIDEMPWMDTPKSYFISALEYFWNQHASNMPNVLLIACGSASSWIKKKLISARGGLYNRVTQRMKLLPFNLHETEMFINALGVKLSRYQLIEIYMVMGGIPFYLKELSKGKSAAQLVDTICFSPQGLLYDEYAQLYHSLFKNADLHISVIEALASRPLGLTRAEISVKTKLSEGSLSRTLEELVECDFISVYQPLVNRKKHLFINLQTCTLSSTSNLLNQISGTEKAPGPSYRSTAAFLHGVGMPLKMFV